MSLSSVVSMSNYGPSESDGLLSEEMEDLVNDYYTSMNLSVEVLEEQFYNIEDDKALLIDTDTFRPAPIDCYKLEVASGRLIMIQEGYGIKYMSPFEDDDSWSDILEGKVVEFWQNAGTLVYHALVRRCFNVTQLEKRGCYVEPEPDLDKNEVMLSNSLEFIKLDHKTVRGIVMLTSDRCVSLICLT
jgi:hypothetical protein